MRVAITYQYPLSKVGGGTVGCLEIANAMARRGVEVVLFPVGNGPSVVPLVDVDVRPQKAVSRPHYILGALPVAAAVRRAHTERRFDAALSFSWEGALLREALPRSVAVGVVAAAPYALWFGRGPGAHRRLSDHFAVKRPLRRADVVFPLSQSTADDLRRLVGLQPEKMIVTHWGVDPIFSSVARESRPTTTRFLFLGQFDEVKGVEDAVAAFALARPRLPAGARLRLVGPGPVEPVASQIRQLGIGDAVDVEAPVERAQVPELLAWADVAVLPSRAESFGLSIAEAQAAGVPVVAWRTGAVPEVILDGETGWLCEPGDIPALAGALVESLDPGERGRRGDNAKARAACYRWDRTVEIMLTALEGSGQSPAA